MLEDIKFDLQTLDYRALGAGEWAELKNRLEQRARADRQEAVRTIRHDAYTWLGPLTTATSVRVRKWLRRLNAMLAREWSTDASMRRRRMTVVKLGSLHDRQFKNIGLGRFEPRAAYRHDPSSFR
jgi:hypothetical protein